MRLQKVEKGKGPMRIVFPIMGWKTGARVPDVVRTILYRPEMFGKAFNNWIEAILRGPSPWTVWERELFASFTSRLNQCEF